MTTPLKFRTRRGVVVFRLTKKLGRGKVHVAESYSARWVRNGTQYYFPLGPVKRAAGKLADEIDTFLALPMHTIEQAIERYNPAKWEKMNPAKRAATVGDVLKAHETAEPALEIEKNTARDYRNALLLVFRVALAHRRAKSPTEEQIKAMGLDELNGRLASDWKVARTKAAGDDRAKVETAKRSANAVFRSICGLFSREALPHYAHLHLPANLKESVAALEFRTVEKKRYRLPAAAVIERVMSEAWQLRDGFTDKDGRQLAPDLNAYLLWLMAAHAGFRKDEGAHAVREWIEPGKPPRLWVRSTKDFIAKGTDEGFAEVESWVVEELERFGGPSRIMAGLATERTDDAPFRLNLWLKARGLCPNKSEKALHGLRKLFGSYIASTRGIFVAQKFLRHKTVDITNNDYADAILDKALTKLWADRPRWVPVSEEEAGTEILSV